MPYTWDLKEMAFVSNLEFPVRLETFSWTFGNDREEMSRGGGSLSFPWVRLQEWGRWLGMTGPNFARVPGSIHWRQRGGEGCHQLSGVAAKPSAGQRLFYRAGCRKTIRIRATRFCCLLRLPCFQESSTNMPLVIDKGETSFLFLLCSLVTLCLLYH